MEVCVSSVIRTQWLIIKSRFYENFMMNIIEEKLYIVLMLDCESSNCLNTFEPTIPASDPMEIWAKEKSTVASNIGWHITSDNKVNCPNCK